MVTSALVKDNRPEAVSSAHWGDVSTTSFEAAFLDATLKSLAIKIPALSAQDNDIQNPPGSITFTSVDSEITKSQCNQPGREETRM
jgi:hypothetical protein